MIGYQGIGKSTLGGKHGCVDLESGNFWIGDRRDSEWYIPYCNIAMHLANQGYTVFTSSHKKVVEYFSRMPLLPNVGKVVIFCPRLSMKKQWITKLKDRYDSTHLEKDYKAWMNAKDKYEENITDLYSSGLPVYFPHDESYELIYYVFNARYDWCKER